MTTTCSRIQLSRLFDEWNSSGSPLVGTHAATHLWVYRLEIPDDSQVDNAVDVKWALVCFGRSGAPFFYSSSPENTSLWTTYPSVLSTAKLRQVISNLTLDHLPALLPRHTPLDPEIATSRPIILPCLQPHYGDLVSTDWIPFCLGAPKPQAADSPRKHEIGPLEVVYMRDGKEIKAQAIMECVCIHCTEALKRLLL